MGGLLDALFQEGRAAWPGLEVARDALARFLADRLPDEDDVAAWRRLPAADLYLACACAAGDPAAIAAFERRYFPDVEAAVAGMRAPGGMADEVKQILRTRFFVAEPGRTSAIAEFAGRGDLSGWVRVSAVREVLRIYHKQKRQVELADALLGEIAPELDPETAAVKEKCKHELAGAFRAALQALPVRERTLLRYQIVDGLGVDAIGSIFRVHRATAARWLARIREELIADTQARLATRLQLDADEVNSVIRLVRSQLDVSIVSLLGGADLS